MKIKESKKIDKYLNLSWEPKTLENIKAMVIPVMVGALGKSSISQEKSGETGDEMKNQDHPDNHR